MTPEQASEILTRCAGQPITVVKEVVQRSALDDLVEPGQPQCGATPPGLQWPVCARPPGRHAGKGGRHQSADFAFNDTGWLAALV